MADRRPPSRIDPEEAKARPRLRTFESLSEPLFRIHQGAWITSSAAMQMAIIARPWLAYDVSDSALALGVVAAAQGLTQVLASPFGGLAADRLPKKLLLLGHPYQNLLPVFQKDVLELGPSGLGFMFTAIGVGALVSSLVIASFSGLSIKGYPQLLAAILFGAALAVFAISTVYSLSLAALFVTGFASQAFGTMNGTKMIYHTDPALYGRVSSVQTMTRAFMPMAALPFGALTDAFGAPVTVAIGGVLLMASIFLVGAAQPALWRTEEA